LKQLNEKLYQFIYSLLKLGGPAKDSILAWIGSCLHANSGLFTFEKCNPVKVNDAIRVDKLQHN